MIRLYPPLYSQGIVFIAAGFETTASCLSTICYSLARNPDVFQTLLEEVDDITEKFDGVVNHETITDMPYLDACIKVSNIGDCSERDLTIYRRISE